MSTRSRADPVNASGLVCLGRILGAHGVKGNVHVESYCTNPEALASYGPLVTEGGCMDLALSIRKTAGHKLVAAIAGVDTREQAESLKGARLYVGRDRFPEPAGDEHYVADLIGLKAVDASRHELGTVVAVQNYGAGDILEIGTRSSTRTILLPFTKDAVRSIDRDAGQIVVDPPDGVM